MGEGVAIDLSKAMEYMRCAASAGVVPVRDCLQSMLRQFDRIPQHVKLSVQDLKLSADTGSVDSQLRYAHYLVDHARNRIDLEEAEKYFILASKQGHSNAQVQYGIALLSGLLGRFDFSKARNLFQQVVLSSGNRFADTLFNALSPANEDIVHVRNFVTIFSVLRSDESENIPMIKLMNRDVSEMKNDSNKVFQIWQMMIRSSIPYLLDVSQLEDVRNPATLRSLPTDLTNCRSVSEMISLIFRLYSIESSLYKNVNRILRIIEIQFRLLENS
jgi:hypothetical protein